MFAIISLHPSAPGDGVKDIRAEVALFGAASSPSRFYYQCIDGVPSIEPFNLRVRPKVENPKDISYFGIAFSQFTQVEGLPVNGLPYVDVISFAIRGIRISLGCSKTLTADPEGIPYVKNGVTIAIDEGDHMEIASHLELLDFITYRSGVEAASKLPSDHPIFTALARDNPDFVDKVTVIDYAHSIRRNLKTNPAQLWNRYFD